MQLSCYRLLTTNTLKNLLFLAWCCFFTLPLINSYGQINGYWVSLCTTNGVEMVLVQDANESTTEHKHHETSKCPCVQHIVHTSLPTFYPPLPSSHYAYPDLTSQLYKHKTYPSLLPRAPPSAFPIYLS